MTVETKIYQQWSLYLKNIVKHLLLKYDNTGYNQGIVKL